jgi:signal transduction histidine kinase
VVSSPAGERTLAIEGASHPYHLLLNAMGDGAALLEPHGTILFGNRRLGEMGRVPLESLRGFPFQQLVSPAERASFEEFLKQGPGHEAAEFVLVCGDECVMPVRIALSRVDLEAYAGGAGAAARNGATVLMAIITELTDQKEAEATRLDLTKRLMFAQDEERRRIARELHDEAGQSLSALVVGLRAIEEQAITSDVQSAAQALQRVAAQTVDNVGRLARGLHPSVLDDVGLVAAARRYAGDYARSFGIPVELAVEGLDAQPVPPLMATSLYRILQEALTNVARHARARKVVVGLTGDGSTLELLVRDDGVGFAGVAGLSETAGLGLHGMRERVTLLGGSLEIDSRPGHGTIVRARIPVGIAPPPPEKRSAGPGMTAADRIRHRGPN